jgi:hypothetical protein
MRKQFFGVLNVIPTLPRRSPMRVPVSVPPASNPNIAEVYVRHSANGGDLYVAHQTLGRGTEPRAAVALSARGRERASDDEVQSDSELRDTIYDA